MKLDHEDPNRITMWCDDEQVSTAYIVDPHFHSITGQEGLLIRQEQLDRLFLMQLVVHEGCDHAPILTFTECQEDGILLSEEPVVWGWTLVEACARLLTWSYSEYREGLVNAALNN